VNYRDHPIVQSFGAFSNHSYLLPVICKTRGGVLPAAEHGRKPTRAADGDFSVAAWMELFYASLLDHNPAKLSQRLQLVKHQGNNQELHRAASRSERQILRAALQAIDDLERQPARDNEKIA
jgi:hypothetical protein